MVQKRFYRHTLSHKSIQEMNTMKYKRDFIQRFLKEFMYVVELPPPLPHQPIPAGHSRWITGVHELNEDQRDVTNSGGSLIHLCMEQFSPSQKM